MGNSIYKNFRKIPLGYYMYKEGDIKVLFSIEQLSRLRTKVPIIIVSTYGMAGWMVLTDRRNMSILLHKAKNNKAEFIG